ncbi:HAD hydrolase-like protein [Wenzhouxiangella sp. EGI_FJ10305]|uniref:HAD hydrolase-like protein n=1 Tax=Wenzhouxiangella sp. EGI_FJ10305 TaxID=3243768 RepID=UPI0035D5A9A9
MNLLLDLDGTLTDPREGITRCIQHALERLDRPVPGQDELLGCIGPPLHASFVELLGGDEALAHRAVELYRGRFGEVGLYENVPYPGIAEAMDTLRQRGARLFVATSKPTVYARRIVDHFGLDRNLEDVFGSDLDGTRSDKADLLAYITDCLALKPEATLMVGDRRHDMIGARANRIHPVGVTWGYGSRDELLEAGAARLLCEPQDLARLVGH